jgi:hypothetical protein
MAHCCFASVSVLVCGICNVGSWCELGETCPVDEMLKQDGGESDKEVMCPDVDVRFWI